MTKKGNIEMKIFTKEEKRYRYIQHCLRGYKEKFQPLEYDYYLVLCSIIEAEILGE